MNRPTHNRQRSRSLFRSALRHESLERRDLMTVTSQLLSGGILQIRMDADRDAAEVSINRGELTVRGTTTDSFSVEKINSIQVTKTAGENQSITFQNDLTIVGSLSVTEIDTIRFATGNYIVGSAAIVSSESIDFSSFQLRASGNVSVTAHQSVSSTETGVIGFLGAVSQAGTSIRLTDSSLFGAQIDVLAQTIIDANANGDNSDDINRDFARVKTVGNAEIVISGRSTINATGNVRLQADMVQTVIASAAALPTSNNAARDAALALTNVTSHAVLSLSDATTILRR